MNRFEKIFLSGFIALAIILSAICFILHKKHEIHLQLVKGEANVQSVQ